jgi:ABC-type multidrug transport system ATPase subunit
MTMLAPRNAEESTRRPDRVGTAFVAVRDLVKRYRSGVVANAGVDFEADLGEIVAILGPNGAGKTTFILQLLGLLAPTGGSIVVGGVDVVRDPTGVKRLASYQPQGHMAMGGVEVHRVLAFTASLRGLAREDASRQAVVLVEEFGLSEVRTQPLNQLSGGWRRLVDVAVAFAGHPRLIVLDEPTNDLDPVHRRVIWDKLDRLRRSRQATALLVTHNLLEAERVVDRVAVMQRGRIVALGSPGALKGLVGGDLRLDVALRPGVDSRPVRAALGTLGTIHDVRPDLVRLFVSREAVSSATGVILSDPIRELIDDFRLAPPSLEDVYLRL